MNNLTLNFNKSFQYSSYDLKPVNKLLNENRILEILEDSNLFWLAFMSSIKENNGDEFYAKVEAEKELISIEGYGDVWASIKSCVEEIRKIFHKSFVNKENVIFGPVDVENKCFIKEQEVELKIDIPGLYSINRNKDYENSVSHLYYSWHVDENVIAFSNLISINCLRENYQQSYSVNNGFYIQKINSEIRGYKIIWN